MRKKLKITGIISLLACFIIACTAAYALFVEPNLLTVKRFRHSDKSIKRNIKIVFFSDTHFGRSTSPQITEELAQLINAQNADVVIFGGDFLDNYYRDKATLDIEFLKKSMASIDAAHKFAVYGNHDYGGGAIKIYREIMQDAGFKILINESVELGELGLEIIGADDAYTGTFRKAELSPKTANLPIYICHQPDVANDIMQGENAIMFSGHTHGGQVLLPFITENILPRYGRKYRKGEFEVNGGRLFVSSGIGTTSIPVRFLNTPEIVVLDIVSEEE